MLLPISHGYISAAAKSTKGMRFVTGVTAPIYRYHPAAILAQAFASMDVLSLAT
jgi:alkanesulfonate monooxygenase SsuD/methylene tetrahydromethanopterin reductase-like flavin-dependent oxidoreductase (luciferase family)